MEGVLSKWTNVMKGWQYRFFVLDENSGLLSYYTSKEKMMKGVRRGCVRLKGAVIGIDDQEDNTFTITVDHKTFHFQARDGDEREKWVRRLEDTIRRHISYRGKNWDNNTANQGNNGNNQTASKRLNHIQLLDKKISEADAYLQLMIEQINKLDTKISEISDREERSDCQALQENANAMLDHIKHSIVTLQIAKNMANPVNGVYQGPPLSSIAKESPSMQIDSAINEHLEFPPVGIPTIQYGIEFGAECLDARNKLFIAPPPVTVMSLIVPETSYSSSEGEDDYFDANDAAFDTPGSSPKYNSRTFSLELAGTNETDVHQQSSSKGFPKEQILEKHDDGSSASDSERNTFTDAISAVPKPQKETRKVPFHSDGSLDYDALYEDDDDTDLSMESHGSVVSHLLSQVKIGMDLTKVVLPTFILERRSLLEMYADYFAHPDLFLKIADLEDPRDRIVQVCRWYLSVYHAGRKSSVAKKPYNPILGEIFQCHWDITEETDDKNLADDGPIPWCRKDQLTFLAEQVSHHPPISAFYAEHYNKKITFAAHVWTKSKFLGLSIGVHNIGQGVVTLCDRNEEYILTFPNGYARSILTVPWIELGGSVTINCPQTGYHVAGEFLTKPFYGGKRNKISAEVFAPNEKKPFVTITGEWTGLMEAKWHDGTKNKPEPFIDVNKIPIHKKLVRPIAEQDEMESRKVWKEVTAGLKLNDIERATSAKCNVEQKQRDEAKVRKDTEGTWDNKYFKPVADAWIYQNPLNQRLYLQEKDNKR